MKKWIIILSVATACFGWRTVDSILYGREEIKAAVELALPLLASSSSAFLANADPCHSCHGQALGVVAFSMAMANGVAVNDTLFKEALGSIKRTWTRRAAVLAQNEDPAALTIGGGYDLWAYSAAGSAPDKQTALLAKNLMQRQTITGNWVSPNSRPPSEYYSFTATALAVKGIRVWMPPAFKEEVDKRVTKAVKWMLETDAENTEELAFKLLGLKWAVTDRDLLLPTARVLIQQQQADGGWAQLPGLPTDAYATGEALYALNAVAALEPSHPVYQRGIAFLLKTQFNDGSWKVQTRSFPSVAFVDSGFPHEVNQFISAAGTNWAVMALLPAL